MAYTRTMKILVPDFAFCGARLQACRVDSRVDVLLRRKRRFVLRSNPKSMRYHVFSTSCLIWLFTQTQQPWPVYT